MPSPIVSTLGATHPSPVSICDGLHPVLLGLVVGEADPAERGVRALDALDDHVVVRAGVVVGPCGRVLGHAPRQVAMRTRRSCRTCRTPHRAPRSPGRRRGGSCRRADLCGQLVGVAPVVDALGLRAEQGVQRRHVEALDVPLAGLVATVRPSMPTASSVYSMPAPRRPRSPRRSIGREASEMSVSPAQKSWKPSPVPGRRRSPASGLAALNFSPTTIEMGSTVEEPDTTTEPLTASPPPPPRPALPRPRRRRPWSWLPAGASVGSELLSSLPQAAATSDRAMAPPRRLRRRGVFTCRSP